MRKHIAILAALLAVLICVASLLPVGLPDEETLIADRFALTDGTAVMADNQPLTSRIYWLRDGALSRIYRESRLQNGAGSAIRLLDVKGDKLHFLRTYEDGQNSWELFRLEADGPVGLCRSSLPKGTVPTGLSVDGSGSWLTAVDSEGQIRIYDCTAGTEEEPGAVLRSILPALGGMDTIWARYDGTRTEVRTEQGDHYYARSDGGVDLLEDEASALRAPELNVEGWLECKRTVLLPTLGLWLVLAVIYLSVLGICRRARTLAVRLTAVVFGCILVGAAAASGVALYFILEGSGVAAFWNSGKAMLLGVVLVAVLAAVLSWIVVRRVTRPLSDMSWQMARVSEGHFNARNVDQGRDELCEMDRNLQEMCMSLSIRDYELNSTLRSYSRFVPQQLTKLLDRANLAEVSMGDSRSLVENVGVFSVGNRDQVRATVPDESFVKFINNSFSGLYQSVDESRGVLLSGGLQLAEMEAMFPKEPADGVRAGLDFLGRMERSGSADCPAARLFVLLHRASFLYGLAGQEERLFPYISSSELDFLSGFSQKLYEAGARIVVTEDYWNQLEGFTGRYIGFLSDEERGTAYKLYEILDAYPEMERSLRIRCDAQFQEALNLYYHNDFYLARNLFSSLLRDCPGDGVARWYLFACEYYFNRVEDNGVNYSLFGVKV